MSARYPAVAARRRLRPRGSGFAARWQGTEFSLVTNLALAMVGFPLGKRLALRELHRVTGWCGRFPGMVLATATLVFAGVGWASGNAVAALILAGRDRGDHPARPARASR